MIPKFVKFLISYPILLISLLLNSGIERVNAQVNDCSFAYFNAMNLFNSGNIDSAYRTLNSCFSDDNLFRKTSRKTKADICRLSALSSILLDDPDGARSNVKRLLSYEPYYRENFKQGDFLEFRKMVDDFSVQPKLVVGVNGFYEYSTVSVVRAYAETSSGENSEISISNNFGGGIIFENSFTKRISAGLGAGLYRYSLNYRGSDIPFSSDDSYNLDFLYFEVPVYVNYRLRIDKKIKPYFQIGVMGRIYLKGNSDDAPDFLRSPEYGPYYMKENQSEGDNGVLALFFENYENLDLSVGGGIAWNFRKSCIDLNLGLMPFNFHTSPLENIETVNDLPHNEWFTLANETVVIDLRRIMRLSLSYKYFLTFKAF